MPLDPRLEAVRATLPADVDRSLPPQVRRQAVRDRRAQHAGQFSSLGPDVLEQRDLVVPTEWGGVRVRLYRPREGVLPGLIHIHGGGWWQGDLDDEDPACRRRAVGADCAVLSIEYRLAPEHPFPAGLDDCWAACRWIADNAHELGVDPERIVVSGGSAGGNLAAAVTLLARDAGAPRFVAQVLEAPGMDLTWSGRSVEEFGTGYGITTDDLKECARFYLGGQDPTDPLVSPLFAELHDLPPALVTSFECDPTRDAAEAYATKLAAAGVPVTLRRFDGLAHGTGELDLVLPEIAQEYRSVIFDFLRASYRQVSER